MREVCVSSLSSSMLDLNEKKSMLLFSFSLTKSSLTGLNQNKRVSTTLQCRVRVLKDKDNRKGKKVGKGSCVIHRQTDKVLGIFQKTIFFAGV